LTYPVEGADATASVNSCQAKMSSTFLQPSWDMASWDAVRWDRELAYMEGVGIRTVILQWSVDMDANLAYYADPPTWYPRGADIVGSLMSAAARRGTSVWLGLGNVYTWQAHAGDQNWLYNQLYVNARTADHLYALYPGQFRGWYISNEVDDSLLATAANVGPMTWFFSALTDYLHTHDGGLAVSGSVTYSGLNQSTEQFSHSVSRVLGSLDVLHVQDGGGSGYIEATDIRNWFSALAPALAATGTALWHDADMYASPSGPMDPARLQTNLNATCGLVRGHSGFSFTTQMSPAGIGQWSHYLAYKRYVWTGR